MKEQKSRVRVLTLVVFLLCLCIGFWLAQRKPLWNDEIYSQLSSIEGFSYAQILFGQIQEGNVTPAFYLLQKSICGLFQYQSPEAWDSGPDSWGTSGLRDRLILRLMPNIFMSLGLALIFYFFARYYSVAFGFYSLATALTSFMVWSYWAEARPYSQWFFLTTLQTVLFLLALRSKKISLRLWSGLVITHMALALSVLFSLAQIVIVSLLLLILKERKWLRYLGLTLVPVVIGLFYYSHSPKYNFWFLNSALELICASIAKERFVLFGIWALGFGLWAMGKKSRMRTPQYFSAKWYMALTGLMIAAAAAMLALFKFGEKGKMVGFQISNRYFMFLASVGIFATVLCAADLLAFTKGRRWLHGMVLAGLAGMLFFRAIKTWVLVFG